MRRFILMLGVLFPTAISAQTTPTADDKQTDLLGKGTVGVSLNGGGSYTSYNGGMYRLTPRVSYFLKDGWSVSLEGRYENYASRYRYTGLGISTRYYFVRDRRLALFLQAGLTAGANKITPRYYDLLRIDPNIYSSTSRAIQTNASLGIHYRLSSRWAIEGNLEGTAANRRNSTYTEYHAQGNVGVSFKIK